MLINIIIVLAPLISVLLIVYLPWVWIAVLLMVPVLKYPLLYYLPVTKTVDLTVLVCALVGIAVVCRWLRKRCGNRGLALSVPWAQLACMSFIALLLFLGTTWTSAPEYGFRKAIRFTGIGIPFLLLPTFFVYSKKDTHLMILVIALVGLLVAPILLVLPTSAPAEMRYGPGYSRVTFFGSDANAVAAVIGLSLVTLLTRFVIKGISFRLLPRSTLLAVPLLIAAILYTGSKVTLLGVVATTCFLPLVAGKRNVASWGFATGFTILLLAIILFTSLRPENKFLQEQRWYGLIEQIGTMTITDNTRTEAWNFCISHWWHKPVIGHGPGSFAMDFAGWDSPVWPHNIVLEGLYEIGLLGTIAIVLFFVVTVRTGLRGLRQAATAEEQFLIAAPFAMVIFMTTYALTHWGLDGNRYLYFFSGLLYVSVKTIQAPERGSDLPRGTKVSHER